MLLPVLAAHANDQVSKPYNMGCIWASLIEPAVQAETLPILPMK